MRGRPFGCDFRLCCGCLLVFLSTSAAVADPLPAIVAPTAPVQDLRTGLPKPKPNKSAKPARKPRLEPLVKPGQGSQKPVPLGLCDGS